MDNLRQKEQIVNLHGRDAVGVTRVLCHHRTTISWADPTAGRGSSAAAGGAHATLTMETTSLTGYAEHLFVRRGGDSAYD